MTINYLKYGIVSALILAIVVMFSVSFVKANPSFFIRQNNGTGTTATTSVSYMTAGTATTTYYLDSQANGNPFGADSATLLWQFTASSTNSTQDMYLEYAQSGDCITTPTSCDWYYHATSTVSNSSVAATSPFARWQFASTTQGLGTSGASRGLREIEIPTPTRYARVMFVIPSSLIANGTASSSAVWAEIVGKKQN